MNLWRTGIVPFVGNPWTGTVREEDMMEIRFAKEHKDPLFDINDRNFNVKAWYLKNDEKLNICGDALIELRYKNKLVRKLIYPAYKIFNIATHFRDIVDGELSKSEKERGYLIAGSDGLGGCVTPREV